ncbi:UDP-glucuronosyl/UDP-glucosyltransferase [Artemisia annua]|uniref:Glycosyltransferase n=1 Tax=Artemisia annua TaxID=35608 RepID=A0A2U1PRG2_ARTAN|nr:UDP-glucuronosyl/UDP-glucosyltransferase [Artemisia annua]
MPLRDRNKWPHVVFIPIPAQSHIKCMLKLARLLHHKGLQITFVNTESNHNLLLKSSGSHDLNGAPSFQFKTVPDGVASTWDGEREPIKALDQVSKYLGTNFLDSFLDLVAGLDTPVTCIICDGFMTFTKTPLAAEKLGVPIILFWTFAACGFMGFYQAKALMEKGLVPLKDESYLTNGYLDTLIDVPGMKGIRLKDLPEHVYGLKPMAWALKFMVEAAQMADKVSHVIIHTFDELEDNLIKELKSIFTDIYTVGPLQLLLDQNKEIETMNFSSNGYSLWKEEPECVQWLESKEPNSVVYVNFGSLTVMSLQDLLEFGWGLVNSNYSFLWIIRHDLVGRGPAVLPKELEEAIKRKGLIASWCSQEDVLAHSSVGGFLTHGGWGSVIESLSAGVPMICWPFSGDQRTNCRQMCKEWEVGMEIGRNVKRDEVEKVLRELMEGVDGRKMRNKAMDWKKMAENATGPNGSSSQNIEKLVNKISMFSRNLHIFSKY